MGASPCDEGEGDNETRLATLVSSWHRGGSDLAVPCDEAKAKARDEIKTSEL